jgi:uncharacterized protein YdiU (UPF0061 family)
MALTNAEKQARYRQRIKDSETHEKRLNLYIDLETKMGLERMSEHLGVTKKEILNRAILQMQLEIVNAMTSPEQADFYRIDDVLAEKRTAAIDKKYSKKLNTWQAEPAKTKKPKRKKEENLSLDF